jgi:hypothetical protein
MKRIKARWAVAVIETYEAEVEIPDDVEIPVLSDGKRGTGALFDYLYTQKEAILPALEVPGNRESASVESRELCDLPDDWDSLLGGQAEVGNG